MERELWPPLYRLLRAVGKQHHQKYVQFQPWVIVAIMLWAALHDRTVAWACQARHWSTTTVRPLQRPSDSTISRRVDTIGVGLLWRALEERLRARGDPALVAFVDGKPLPIGGCSKAADARWGRGAGVIAKGYKLHAVGTTRAVPEAWPVTPLNANEQAVAAEWCSQWHHGGYLLADGNDDASYLDDAAWERGYPLVASCKQAQAPGSGNHDPSPQRRRSLDLLDGAGDKAACVAPLRHDCGKRLYQTRASIERSFGHATVFAGGLAPLPAWVRGWPRVRTWVWAKLLINGVRILRLQHKHLRPALQ